MNNWFLEKAPLHTKCPYVQCTQLTDAFLTDLVQCMFMYTSVRVKYVQEMRGTRTKKKVPNDKWSHVHYVDHQSCLKVILSFLYYNCNIYATQIFRDLCIFDKIS